MATRARRGNTPHTRAQAADADIRELLSAGPGEARAAFQRARNAYESELAHLGRVDPDRAALLAAAQAGSLAAIAAHVPATYPQAPPGYLTGTPRPQDLIAVYQAAREHTHQQLARSHR